MGVGLYLTGNYRTKARTAAGWLRRVEQWLEEHAGETFHYARQEEGDDGHPRLAFSLYPAAEDVQLVVPEVGRMIVSAQTSTVGPGYHCHLCDLLHRLGEDNGVTWDDPDPDGDTGDETGYFHTGEVEDAQKEMLTWLKSVAAIVLENLDSDESRSLLTLSMPMSHHYSHHGPVVTPMGPRDRAWFDAVRDDPAHGVDFFAWWNHDLDARYYLGRALYRMWTAIRWRPPLTDEESDLIENVMDDLETACDLNEGVLLPWREWQELLDFSNWPEREVAEDVRRNAATTDSNEPLIGYRRKPVRVDLTGGWNIEIPGEMAEEWNEEGTWSAWDGRRTIWFTAFSRTRKDETPMPAEVALADAVGLEEGEKLGEWRSGAVVGRAVFLPYEEEGEPMWNLKAFSAVEGGLAICNIYLNDLNDRDWAIQQWQALKHPGPETPAQG